MNNINDLLKGQSQEWHTIGKYRDTTYFFKRPTLEDCAEISQRSNDGDINKANFNEAIWLCINNMYHLDKNNQKVRSFKATQFNDLSKAPVDSLFNYLRLRVEKIAADLLNDTIQMGLSLEQEAEENTTKKGQPQD